MIRIQYRVVIILLMLVTIAPKALVQTGYLLEAESFAHTGGWSIDQQFFEIMGSSYLIAHGLGKPVGDAKTQISLPAKGKYYVWVRTKDWAPYPIGPGKFELKIGTDYCRAFGATGQIGWQWIPGGTLQVSNPNRIDISLTDLTGFDGRCDAIYFTTKKNDVPPSDYKAMMQWRKELLHIPEQPKLAGNYDLVVTGGGMAGICTAVVAARQGLKVALIQDRPVLGGNNSSEIRVHLMGLIDLENPYPVLGRVVRELDNGDPENANPDGRLYGDDRKAAIVASEKNIDLYLNMFAYKVEKEGDMITAIVARNIKTNEDIQFAGTLFADCTGDGTIASKAGADYRIGRESKFETGESLAPDTADNFVLGATNMWYAADMGQASQFPETPWALQFSDEYFINSPTSEWFWETGFNNFDPLTQAEEIRDHNFRAVYGNWSYLKNKTTNYSNYALTWVSYIAGKRESRRISGDYILTQMDCEGTREKQPDAFVTATWTIDLHFPDADNSKYFPGEEFLSATEHIRVKPYQIPYRCLYSRNINNLFMAGRNISTTHVAFGSTRVMRTTGMMGELVGYAASLAIKYNTSPRGVYESYCDELKKTILGN